MRLKETFHPPSEKLAKQPVLRFRHPHKDVPKGSYRLVHISDLHISFQHYREHIKSLRFLLRNIAWRGCDHLLITGDLSSTGLEDDLIVTRELLEAQGFSAARRLTVIPGNHDIYGGPHRAHDVVHFPSKVRSTEYESALSAFMRIFAMTLEGAVYLHTAGGFPFVKQAGPFAVIGLNSVAPWSVLKNPIGSNGLVDHEQVGCIQALAESPVLERLVPICAVHHHFNDLARDASSSNTVWLKIEARLMKQRKKKRLVRALREAGVAAILHGHVHSNELYEWKGLPFANGAGAVCDDPVAYLKYNVLDYRDGHCTLETVVLPIAFQKAPARLRSFPAPALPAARAEQRAPAEITA